MTCQYLIEASNGRFCRVARHEGRHQYQANCEGCPLCKEVIVPLPPPPRPDLAALAATLPGEWLGSWEEPEFLPDGSIVYKKIGWEPPPSIEGYVRDKDNKWTFHPLWPVCEKRVGRAFVRGSCGCVQVEMTCDGKKVSLTDCRLCKGV